MSDKEKMYLVKPGGKKVLITGSMSLSYPGELIYIFEQVPGELPVPLTINNDDKIAVIKDGKEEMFGVKNISKTQARRLFGDTLIFREVEIKK